MTQRMQTHGGDLERGAGIPACTLARLLADLDNPTRVGLGWETIVVVDEAGMVGTRRLLRLSEHTHAWHAKLVLVGDHHQLPEIDAGGAFAALTQRLDPIVLSENRRQHDPVERAALAQLRNGDPGVGLELLTEHGRVTEHATRGEAIGELARDWADAALDGHDALMLAVQRPDLDSLNRAARDRLRAEGALEPDALHAGGRDYAVGDWIVTTRNDYRHHLINGQRGVVVAIDPRRRTLVADLDEHGRIAIPTEYLDTGHVEHAYALTAHKAQGLTCDRTYVLGDNRLYREAGYTALSRGRHHNRLYTIATATEPVADPCGNLGDGDAIRRRRSRRLPATPSTMVCRPGSQSGAAPHSCRS